MRLNSISIQRKRNSSINQDKITLLIVCKVFNKSKCNRFRFVGLYGRRIFKVWHTFLPLAFKCLFLRLYLKSNQEYLPVHSLNCLFLNNQAEEPEIKLPTSAGSLKKARESQKNIYFCFIDYAKPLTLWITINCGKFWKRWEYQTTPSASWEICMQVRKQQLELDMEQQTGSK